MRRRADSHIARIRTYHLMCPLPEPLISAQLRILRNHALLVQIETVGGAVGWGECAGVAEVAQAAIQSFYGPLAIGRDVLDHDVLYHDLYRASLPHGARGMMPAALSGIDMALWDLRGRMSGQSLSRMIGGSFRDRVPCYVVGQFFREVPESELIPCLVDEAHEYVEQGYRTVKTRVGRNPAFDASLVRALRNALPHTALAADADRAYDLAEALQLGRILEELNYAWFEEPLSAETPQLNRRLADAIRIPIAAGQNAQMRWEFQSLLSDYGVTIAQPDLSYCGGPSEALRILAVAGSLGVNLSPHSSGTQLNFAAALHLLACDFRQPGRIESSVGLLGRDGAPNPLRDVLFSDPIQIDGGIARVPNGPGLGVTPDTDEIRFFCVNAQEVTA